MWSVAQSCPPLCTVAHQTPLPMGFSRQERWSGLPFPPPGDASNQGIEPMSPVAPALQVDSLSSEQAVVIFRLSDAKRQLTGKDPHDEKVQFTCLVVLDCNPMDCSMSGFPVHHQLPELA